MNCRMGRRNPTGSPGTSAATTSTKPSAPSTAFGISTARFRAGAAADTASCAYARPPANTAKTAKISLFFMR